MSTKCEKLGKLPDKQYFYLVPPLQTPPEGGESPLSETQQKKIKRNCQIRDHVAKAMVEYKKHRRLVRHNSKMRIYKYESIYRKSREALVDARRSARLLGGFYREDEAKVMFVIRIRGINKIAPKPKKVLQLFRLRQIHNAVFLPINKATTQMMKFIEPFVIYGYLNLSTIRRLLYKRGYARIGPVGHRHRVRLQDPYLITDYLGKYNIDCIEDLVYQLHTCGPHFKKVSSFLWPFKLNSPTKGYVCKRHGFHEPRGGDWGNREHLINELVRRMI